MATLAVLIAMAFMRGTSTAFTVVFVLLLVECFVGIVGAGLAYRPYRAERRLGYTTWPSLAELKSTRSDP